MQILELAYKRADVLSKVRVKDLVKKRRHLLIHKKYEQYQMMVH